MRLAVALFLFCAVPCCSSKEARAPYVSGECTKPPCGAGNQYGGGGGGVPLVDAGIPRVDAGTKDASDAGPG